jgi:hypothetical protein
MDRAGQSRRSATLVRPPTRRREELPGDGRCPSYLGELAAAYFLRNLSTRPAVSTIFCLPV